MRYIRHQIIRSWRRGKGKSNNQSIVVVPNTINRMRSSLKFRCQNFKIAQCTVGRHIPAEYLTVRLEVTNRTCIELTIRPYGQTRETLIFGSRTQNFVSKNLSEFNSCQIPGRDRNIIKFPSGKRRFKRKEGYSIVDIPNQVCLDITGQSEYISRQLLQITYRCKGYGITTTCVVCVWRNRYFASWGHFKKTNISGKRILIKLVAWGNHQFHIYLKFLESNIGRIILRGNIGEKWWVICRCLDDFQGIYLGVCTTKGINGQATIRNSHIYTSRGKTGTSTNCSRRNESVYAIDAFYINGMSRILYILVVGITDPYGYRIVTIGYLNLPNTFGGHTIVTTSIPILHVVEGVH